MGDRSASTLMAIAPFGVVSVTVRVSPAGSAGGWVVGHDPAGTAPPDAAATAVPDGPGLADAAAPPVPVPGLKTTRMAIRATTAIAAAASHGTTGRRLVTPLPWTGWVVLTGVGAGAAAFCCAPRRRLPRDPLATGRSLAKGHGR